MKVYTFSCTHYDDEYEKYIFVSENHDDAIIDFVKYMAELNNKVEVTYNIFDQEDDNGIIGIATVHFFPYGVDYNIYEADLIIGKAY